jgi:hypothetical protein
MTIIKVNTKIQNRGKKITVTINNKSENKPIKLKQIKSYARKLITRYNINSDGDIYIRGLGILGFLTIKGLNSDIDHMFNNEEEYLQNRVKDDTKFTEFKSVQFVLFR